MPAVTAIVGSDTTTARIWNSWQRVTGTSAYPCLVMDIDGEEEQNDLQALPDLVIAEVTITCRASTHDDSDALQSAVKSNGTTPGTGLAGYAGSFQAILDRTTHSEAVKGDGSTAHWYDHIMTFTILWNAP
jgi:hypothetical protein